PKTPPTLTIGQRFASLDRVLPWSLIGALIGVIGIAIGFYYAVLYERPTLVSFEIISQAPVLDIKDDIGGRLDVIYNGQNLSESKKQLVMFVIRIKNSGKTNIVPGHFDREHPFGYKILDGAFAQRPETIDASREELLSVRLTDAEGQSLPIGMEQAQDHSP